MRKGLVAGITHVIHAAGSTKALNASGYFAVNQLGTRALVEAANEPGTPVRRFLLVSSLAAAHPATADCPAREGDAPQPISDYGRSKLAGEQALAASGADWLCLRTSWVYAARGRNFMRTILKLASERTELRIVADQVGAPTPARLIADATAHALRQSLAARREGRFASECLHLTTSGETSWHGFASYLIERARAHGAPALAVQTLHAIASSDYPVPAARPANSRLDCSRFEERFDLHLPDWRTGASLCLSDLLSLTHVA